MTGASRKVVERRVLSTSTIPKEQARERKQTGKVGRTVEPPRAGHRCNRGWEDQRRCESSEESYAWWNPSWFGLNLFIDDCQATGSGPPRQGAKDRLTVSSKRAPEWLREHVQQAQESLPGSALAQHHRASGQLDALVPLPLVEPPDPKRRRSAALHCGRAGQARRPGASRLQGCDNHANRSAQAQPSRVEREESAGLQFFGAACFGLNAPHAHP